MEQTNEESSDIVLPSASLTTNVEGGDSATSTQLLDEGNSNPQIEPEANLNRQNADKNLDFPSVSSVCDSVRSPSSPSQIKIDEKKDLLQLDKENDEEQQNSSHPRDSSTNLPDVSSTTISADENRNHNIDPSLQPNIENKQVNDDNSGESPVLFQESDNVLDEFLTLKTPEKRSSITSELNLDGQNREDSNPQETSCKNPERTSIFDLNDTAEKKQNETNKSDESASNNVGQANKSPPNNENDETSITDECVPANNKEGECVSNCDAENSSVTDNVEQDLYSLFSNSATVEKSGKLISKDVDKCNEIKNDTIDPSATNTKTGIGDAASNKSIDSDELHTKRILPDDENEHGNTTEDLVRHETLQIEDANTSEEKLCQLHSILEGEETTINPEKGSNLLIDSAFTANRIEIKEEIESIENDSLQGFENSIKSNDDDNMSYSSDYQLQKDLCKKECFVSLERCDDTLLNVMDHYQPDMKIVSVESLSSLNYTEKHNIVWSYYTKKSPTLAECKICGRALLHQRLYNLTRHLQKVHNHNSSTTNTESDKLSVTPTPAMKSTRSYNSETAYASSKLVNDPALFKEKPMNYFSFVNSETARCKLCSQYLPYRCLDDLGILKSHLINKHAKTAGLYSSVSKKSAKIWKYFRQLTSSTCVCKLCSLTLNFSSDYFSKLLDHIYSKHSKNFNKQFTLEQDFAEALVNEKIHLISESQRKNLKIANKNVSRHSSSDEEGKDEDDEDEDDNDDDDDDYDDGDNDDDDYDGESNEEPSAQNNSGRQPYQRTWSHFTKLERGLAQCNVCHKCFSYGGGDLRSLTRHLKIGHKDQKSANQSRKKAAPQTKQAAKVPKKVQSSQAISRNSKVTRQSPSGKQFLKYFSFLRSNNALCKKCMTKVPFNKQDTKSLLDHYNKCNPELDSPKKSVSKKRRIAGDGSIKDPDFVPSDSVGIDADRYKKELMTAVELSPKEESLVWGHFKKVNGTMVQCLRCSKRLSYRSGDTWLLEQHLQLWHDIKALKSKNDDGFDASLDDIPLLFRLKNQPQPYTLGDCYYRKKLQYNVLEIGRYFRRLGDNRLICKLCSSHLQCRENSTEVLMSHILQEHVRKLFKPRLSSNEAANTTEAEQTPVSPSYKTTSPQMKSIPMNMPPLNMRKVQAQSTPLPPRNRPMDVQRNAVNTPKFLLSQLYANTSNKEQPIQPKFDFTLSYFLDFGSNRQQCKICNRQFCGKKTSNYMLLSKHLLSNHLKNVIDDETQLLTHGGNEQRKAIINCTRERIVNKFSEINDLKISCKMCSCNLENDGFDSMKTHLLKNHQNYLITILKEVKRIQNYNTMDMRKIKSLLTLRKKRILRAKCSLCSREVCYKVGNTKLLLTHLLKFHRKTIGKISKLIVWKYFSKQNFAESKCEICFKFISSKIHCNHKVPKLFCLSTGLKLKSKKESSSYKNACFYFSAMKQYDSECIFCSKSLKNANKIICKIACRFNHGNEYINWLYKNDPVDQTFVSPNQTDETIQRTLSLLEMFEELKNKKINSIKMSYSELSNKYYCNLCTENISTKYLRFCLYFDHALENHKGLLSMHRALVRPSNPRPQCIINSSMQSTTKSSLQSTPKNTKLVKVKLWHHFQVIGPDLASCNFCKTNFRYTSANVDNLSNHLRVAHLNALLKLSEAAMTSQQPKSPARVKKSSTWNYFTESARGAKCKICDKQFLFSKRTHVSPLTRHLQTVHKIALTEMNKTSQASNVKDINKEEERKLESTYWTYFENDDKRPGTAKCKLCSIYCSVTPEQGDLFTVLQKHLRLVHNKLLANVGNNSKPNNQGLKRLADTDMEARSLVDQSPKRVKFNESDSLTADKNDSSLPQKVQTPLNEKVVTGHSSEGTKVSGQGAASRDNKKSLQHFQELEKTKSKKSMVWTYFTPIDGQPDFSRCNICSKSISSKFGISILRTHLRVKHNILIVNVNQYSELKKSIGDTSSNNGILTAGSSIRKCITSPSGKEQVVSPTKVNSNSSLSKNSINSPWCKFDKNHPVWSYFTVEKNSNLSKCNLCSVYLSCKIGQAEGLQNHLSAKHNIVFVEADPLKNVSKVSGNKSSPVKVLSTNQTVEKIDESIKKPAQESSKSAEELHERENVEESIVENEVFYTTEDNLVTVAERGDPSADETVHYEIVETTHHTEEESTDIVRVISDLLPNYSTGISDDVHATEISPLESELISNIVTSLANPDDQVSCQQEIIGGDQLKSIAVLTGETEDISLTWDFYVKLGDNKVKCDVCSEVLTYEDKDAQNLRDHIQSKHPAELAQYKLSRLDFSDSCIIVVKNAN